MILKNTYTSVRDNHTIVTMIGSLSQSPQKSRALLSSQLVSVIIAFIAQCNLSSMASVFIHYEKLKCDYWGFVVQAKSVSPLPSLKKKTKHCKCYKNKRLKFEFGRLFMIVGKLAGQGPLKKPESSHSYPTS